MGMFSENADKEFPEGAILGSFLSQDPSFNFTMNIQSLTGVTTSTLTASQKEVIVSKNGNYYISEYGAGSFKEGFTSNGDFIDRSRFGLWVKLRGQESLYGTMKSYADRVECLPFNEEGIAVAKAGLYTNVINKAVNNGAVLTGFSTDNEGNPISYTPIVETSTRASQTDSAIARREWEGFNIELVYTGSIHHISVEAYVVNNRTA